MICAASALSWQLLHRWHSEVHLSVEAFRLAGAASLCVFWGPLTGAKIVPYRTAVLSEVGCQILGNVLFGPHHISPYAGVLNSGSIASVANSPELVMYALLCVAVFLPAWHLAALWQRVPLSPITGLSKLYGRHCNALPGHELSTIPNSY